jgi:hypothetical protein
VEFHLDGHRLSGNYALIRIVDEDEDRWLLIKMKNDKAGGDE